MGLDIYIDRMPSHRVDYDNCEEVFYARKFWKLLNADFIGVNGGTASVDEWIESEEDWNELITIAINNPNYFGTYDDVPKLLEARDRWREDKEKGTGAAYRLHADW